MMFNRRCRTKVKAEWPVIAIMTVFITLSLIIFHIANEPVYSDLLQCPEEGDAFHQGLTYNMRKIANYPVTKFADPRLMKKLGLDNLTVETVDDSMTTWSNTSPVLVTATSQGQFSNTKIWFKGIQEKELDKKYRVIVYDLGLTHEQRAQICQKLNCEVRRFPFEQYPNFIKDKLALIAWKPVIIQLCLIEFSYVIWMDSTVFLKTSNFDKGLQVADREKIAVSYKVGIDKDTPLSYSTSLATFQSFGEEPCVFSKLSHFSSGFIIMRKTKFTLKYIMRPWVACALEELCIGGQHEVKTSCLRANHVGFCHRFDLSALSIILHRLYFGETERRKIDLKGKTDWVNCYSRRGLVFIPDEFVVPDGYTYDLKDCPHHLLPESKHPGVYRK